MWGFELIDDAWAEVKRLWSMRLALAGIVFWSAVSGLWVLWPAFAEVLPLWFYAVGGIGMSVALAVARVLKQKGADK